MTKKKTAAIILAAGLGTRMKSDLPKVLHPVGGRPMVAHLLATLSGLGVDRTVVVIGDEMDAVADVVAPNVCAIQEDRLGTAHAVLAARDALADFDGDVLVVYGDTPLIEAETLSSMLEARASEVDPAVVVLGFRPADPGAYGRLITGDDGGLNEIVEASEASDEQAAVDLCNSGVMAFDGAVLFDLLDQIGNDNAKREYYLTDAIALARAAGRTALVVEGEEEELLGINSRQELAMAEIIVQDIWRDAAMDNGVTLTDPGSVHFSFDTKLGQDVTVGPNVFFGPGVTVGDGVEIRAFCHIEGANVDEGAIIGPFARLRPGADIEMNVHIGNFVEIKNAVVEMGAKVNHLSYVGDSRVGEGANIGAGTITCNYDGFAKTHTDIGAGAFIGSNTALVAPVNIGDGAIIGAGSVITKDVAADALALTRADQTQHDGWAKRFRERAQARKDASGGKPGTGGNTKPGKKG